MRKVRENQKLTSVLCANKSVTEDLIVEQTEG